MSPTMEAGSPTATLRRRRWSTVGATCASLPTLWVTAERPAPSRSCALNPLGSVNLQARIRIESVELGCGGHPDALGAIRCPGKAVPCSPISWAIPSANRRPSAAYLVFGAGRCPRKSPQKNTGQTRGPRSGMSGLLNGRRRDRGRGFDGAPEPSAADIAACCTRIAEPFTLRNEAMRRFPCRRATRGQGRGGNSGSGSSIGGTSHSRGAPFSIDARIPTAIIYAAPTTPAVTVPDRRAHRSTSLPTVSAPGTTGRLRLFITRPLLHSPRARRPHPPPSRSPYVYLRVDGAPSRVGR